MERDQFLTVKEISALLGVHIITVGAWIRSGKLRGVALSRKSGYRVRKADFEAFVRERTGRTVKDVERESA